MVILAVLVVAIAWTDEPVLDTPEAISESAKAAKMAYEVDYSSAEKTVLEKLDREIAAAKRKGDSDKVQSMQSQRDVFVSEHVVPEDVTLFAYYTKARSARRTMINNFRKAIARAYALDDTALAEEVDLEFKNFRARCNSDWLQPGDYLSRGDSMISRDGRYEMVLGTDGDIVLSRIDGERAVLWRSKTKDLGGIRLVMGYDGNVVLRDRKSNVVFSTKTSWDQPGKLVLQGDGNLVLFDKDKPIWGSGSDE